ncbi:hypothetical protein MZD04_gp349 [Pseudomonas phage Psa21]|uniref:Uncharacterized protein n=1 Tax=Pseudomonas phage Psa21 TaxID=2530023 RepID=A0A481W5U3_9CAUD|nr:hypothetical protein MZD04_gp349 [Pseudomonas phage Psa21]QBJ02875.1 hypothetical protein PSA21_349 [Pseudomonas phage Psa21]
MHSSTALTLAAIVLVLFLAYRTWSSLIPAAAGGLNEWIDQDFPEIVHTPKPTWLTGFRYKRHGIDAIAKLDVPICLEYEQSGNLGRFSIVDSFARATVATDGNDRSHKKDLVAYNCGLDLVQYTGGQIAVSVVYNRICITEVEPIIEESACE